MGSDVGTGALCPQEWGRQSPWSGAAVRRAWVLQRRRAPADLLDAVQVVWIKLGE